MVEPNSRKRTFWREVRLKKQQKAQTHRAEGRSCREIGDRGLEDCGTTAEGRAGRQQLRLRDHGDSRQRACFVLVKQREARGPLSCIFTLDRHYSTPVAVVVASDFLITQLSSRPVFQHVGESIIRDR